MNKLNWQARFKNPTWLAGFLSLIIAFTYQLLGLFEVVPAISQDEIVQMAGLLINILMGVGVLIDPTTEGFGDSPRAMTYEKPMEYDSSGGPEYRGDGKDANL